MTQSPPRAGAGEYPPRGAGPVSRDRNDDDGVGGMGVVVSLTMVVAMAGLDASLRPFKGGNVKWFCEKDIEIVEVKDGGW